MPSTMCCRCCRTFRTHWTIHRRVWSSIHSDSLLPCIAWLSHRWPATVDLMLANNSIWQCSAQIWSYSALHNRSADESTSPNSWLHHRERLRAQTLQRASSLARHFSECPKLRFHRIFAAGANQWRLLYSYTAWRLLVRLEELVPRRRRQAANLLSPWLSLDQHVLVESWKMSTLHCLHQLKLIFFASFRSLKHERAIKFDQSKRNWNLLGCSSLFDIATKSKSCSALCNVICASTARFW